MSHFPRLRTPTARQGQRIKSQVLTPPPSTTHHSASPCDWEDFQIQQCHFWFCFILFVGDVVYELYYRTDPHGNSNLKSMASNDSSLSVIGFDQIKCGQLCRLWHQSRVLFRKHFSRLKFRYQLLFCRSSVSSILYKS